MTRLPLDFLVCWYIFGMYKAGYICVLLLMIYNNFLTVSCCVFWVLLLFVQCFQRHLLTLSTCLLYCRSLATIFTLSDACYRAACNADAVLWWDFCPSVCLSVRQTRDLWQNGRKISPDFYTIRKNI